METALQEMTTGEMLILDASGHSRIQWNKDDPAQVAEARAKFDEMKAKGYLIYKVDPSGKQDEVIRDFDPDAERIIMQTGNVGG